jgi:cytoskeletal protein RodZ
MRIILTILVLGALLGTGLYYRGPISNKFSQLRGKVTPSPSPALSLESTSTQAAEATATAAPTATPLTSIAEINPAPGAANTPASEVTTQSASNLPVSGPEVDLLLPAGLTLAGIGFAHRLNMQRKLRTAIKNLTIA